MKIVCPICSSKFTIAEMMHEEAMREMIELASKFGKNWGLVFDYTECFRGDYWASIKEQKRLRLLREIWGLFEKCEFELNNKRYRTDWTKIIKALRATVDADRHGFKNHNYLKRVLMGESPERVSAEGMTAKEEREKEQRIMNNEHRISNIEGKSELKRLSAKELKKRAGEVVRKLSNHE